MIRITDKKECCGCEACAQACPHGAIRMKPDSEGFAYPTIDTGACTDCGLCERVCPLAAFDNPHGMPAAAYAAFAADETVRTASSSGGIFSVLAGHFTDRGGLVCGAAFDGGMMLRHILSDDGADTSRMRGSKYLQSSADGCFIRIRRTLAQGREVLYCGTPCQVAGLYNTVGRHPDLTTVDMACHGVASPTVFDTYRQWTERTAGQKAVDTLFRDKSAAGWSEFHVTNIMEDGSRSSAHKSTDAFMRGYLADLFLRPSCHECRFKMPRTADLTLADFWGVTKVCPEAYDNRGVSLVLVNSSRGAELLQDISGSLAMLHETDFADAIRYNPAISKSVKPNRNRERFFREMAAGADFGDLTERLARPTPAQAARNALKAAIKKVLLISGTRR